MEDGDGTDAHDPDAVVRAVQAALGSPRTLPSASMGEPKSPLAPHQPFLSSLNVTDIFHNFFQGGGSFKNSIKKRLL